ncbi:ubiquinone biosynthesis O-methyltransferase, mitochondrial isoform X2 [Cheilinus undulatus]|uniref:ubiquinone biosynthesis O-methyltransferase, mitochondrial isoform X2 n=1 Tax=Cheilinus undulatus TaxID=241271 RepID=UPI001BD57C09|nr:ubiquinone biosynthesis O-methyltransferase, mitochondrial isoform X2 [Cheilinus undulatus]
MYSNKFCRLMLGLYSRKHSAVCGVVHGSSPGRSGFSWTAVCKQRALWLQRSDRLRSQPQPVTCQISARSASYTTVDPDELRRFKALANKWWDEQGEFAALHAMNDLRVPFIRDNLLSMHRARHPGKPLAGLKILDVGCGGGLLTEPLGRLGAKVLGIDPVEDSISTAQLHSSFDPDLQDRVSYRACSLEELSAEEEGGLEEQVTAQFDAVVASEVVEHLADLETFAFCCSQVLKLSRFCASYPAGPTTGRSSSAQWSWSVSWSQMVSQCSLWRECCTTQYQEPGAGLTAPPLTTPSMLSK